MFVRNLVFCCCLFGILNQIFAFQAGYTYQYFYQTSVSSNSNEKKSLYDYRYEFDVDILKSEKSLIFFRLSVRQSSDDLFKHPILFEYDNSGYKVKRIYYNSYESIESLNFKKGILNLFNLNLGSSNELTSIGNCRVEFLKLQKNGFDLRKIKKNCNRNEFLFDDEYSQYDKTLDISIERNNEIDYEIDYEMNLLKNIQAREIIDIYFEFNKNSSRTIYSNQNLKFISKIQLKEEDNLFVKIKDHPNNLQVATVGTEIYDSSSLNLVLKKPNDVKTKSENKNKKKYDDLISNQLKSFKKYKSGTNETCKNFLNLVKTLRNENINEKIISKLSLKKYLKHERIGLITIDAFLAAQTKETVKAILKEFDFKKLNEKLDKKQQKLIEKFLVSSSLSTHTTIEDLYESLEGLLTLDTLYNNELKELAGLAIGSLVQAASNTEKTLNIVNRFYNLIKTELQKCKSNTCREFYLDSLANGFLNESIIEIFEPEIINCKQKPSKICILSLKTLRKFSPNLKLTKSLTNNLFEIFHKNSSENTIVRIEALNLLLHNNEIKNDEQIIINILSSIYNSKDFEFTLYAHKLIYNIINNNRSMKESIEPFLKKFYHNTLKLKGNSEVIQDKFFIAPNGNINYDMKQFSGYNDGIIRSIEFSVNYNDMINKKLTNILSFDIYTENLNAITSTTTGEKGDPTAGLEMSLLNKKIKKTEFFRGYTSLINVVWNAPTSLTTVFETNFLINDQNEYILLQNGLIMNLNTIGALSIDVSALADISMWKQTANTLLQTSVALDIESTLKINHKNDINILNYDFNTNIRTEFYLNANFQKDPLKLCMKLLLNKINLNQTNKKITNKKKQETKNTKITIQPLTYMLSRKAISLCHDES